MPSPMGTGLPRGTSLPFAKPNSCQDSLVCSVFVLKAENHRSRSPAVFCSFSSDRRRPGRSGGSSAIALSSLPLPRQNSPSPQSGDS